MAPRPAAVVLAIFATPPHGVIFIERAAHLRHHAGQIGLPGGGADAEDEGDLRRTALRELHEEIGIVADRVDIVATLEPIHPRVSNFLVTPYVAVVEPGPLVIDSNETAAVFFVPLHTVLERVHDGTMDLGTIRIQTTLLDYDGHRIWGLTGNVLRQFVDRWNANEPMRHSISCRLRDG